jgi:hypothetical protein
MTSALTSLSSPPAEYDMEAAQCTTTQIGGWADARAVESVVANVLWDLVDDVNDPPNGTGIDEVAHVSEEEVIEVITAPLAPHTSCSLSELNSHVMGLDEFWDQWRDAHRDEAGVYEVVPDLYAAYAFNGAAIGNAIDTGAPEPVTIASPSHTTHEWSNRPTVELAITDGIDATPENHDDVSGSYFYFVESDTSPETAVSTSGTPSCRSKELVQACALDLPDGASQYIHMNNADMAGNASTGTSHFGPLHIDTVDPYWTSQPALQYYRPDPSSTEEALVLGYPAYVS